MWLKSVVGKRVSHKVKKAEQRGNMSGNKKSAPKALASRADLFDRVYLMSGFYIHPVFLMWRTSPLRGF